MARRQALARRCERNRYGLFPPTRRQPLAIPNPRPARARETHAMLDALYNRQLPPKVFLNESRVASPPSTPVPRFTPPGTALAESKSKRSRGSPPYGAKKG